MPARRQATHCKKDRDEDASAVGCFHAAYVQAHHPNSQTLNIRQQVAVDQQHLQSIQYSEGQDVSLKIREAMKLPATRFAVHSIVLLKSRHASYSIACRSVHVFTWRVFESFLQRTLLLPGASR